MWIQNLYRRVCAHLRSGRVISLEHRKLQRHGEVVAVGTWASDEEYPIFPVGSKPKRLLICPPDTTLPFLIPGHRYLFKSAEGWQAQQIWSEIVAYEISRLVGLVVPPCFVAVDEKTGGQGVLIEFFYGYPGEATPSRFVHAVDILQRLFLGRFDRKHGRPHVLRMNLAICPQLQVKFAVPWWAQTLGFDALIGNTDRHPENWGFLVGRPERGGRVLVGMAALR
jgi:hypothetical protein